MHWWCSGSEDIKVSGDVVELKFHMSQLLNSSLGKVYFSTTATSVGKEECQYTIWITYILKIYPQI